MRIALVGGGVIGLSAAWRLALAGHGVTVFDGAPGAREASWAAAGMLAPHHEAATLDDLWRFGVHSLALWDGFAHDLGPPAALGYEQRGGWLPLTSSAARAAGEARAGMLARAGIPCERLAGAALVAHEPALASVDDALLLPGGHVDPRRVLAALQAACAHRAVAVHYGQRIRSIRPGTLHLDGAATHACDLVVIASGAWTPALASASGIALAGEPVKGQLVRLAAPDGLLRRFVHAHEAYLVPRPGLGVVVGSTMVLDGFDKGEDPEAIARLAAGARSLVPALEEAAIVETWTGLRPRLIGGRPLVAEAVPGVIVATGHFRNGILLAPATAEAIVALAARAPLAPAARAFSTLPGGTSDTAGVSS